MYMYIYIYTLMYIYIYVHTLHIHHMNRVYAVPKPCCVHRSPTFEFRALGLG